MLTPPVLEHLIVEATGHRCVGALAASVAGLGQQAEALDWKRGLALFTHFLFFSFLFKIPEICIKF
jgi:hypothetical protein